MDNEREKFQSDFVYRDEMRRTFIRTHADPFARALVDLLTHLAEQSTWAGAPYCHMVEIGLPLGAERFHRVIIIKVTRAYNHSNSRQPVVHRGQKREKISNNTDTAPGAVTLECANSR